MARTSQSTEAEPSSGTSSGDEEEEEEYLPPCRVAAMAIVPCPLCGRQMTTKTLRYSHRCGRTFHTTAREQEQRKLAESAVLARMAQQREHRTEHRPLQTQSAERRVEHGPLQTQPAEHWAKQELEHIPTNSGKYAHLFNIKKM